jgi:hypothetical protein
VKGNGITMTRRHLVLLSGPRIVDGLEAPAQAIHPEAFG